MQEKDINKIIAKNISSLLDRYGKTQSDLADYMEVSQATVSNWCKGVKLPRMDKIDKICDFFNVSRTQLMDDGSVEQHSTSKGVSIPILNTVVAGMPVDAYEDILGYEEISRELANTGEFFALKVKGDSMSPVLQEGDILIIRQQPDVESGDIAIVLINGDMATVKKVQKQEAGIMLVAFNQDVYQPHFYTNEDIKKLPVKIAGKVVEMKRSFQDCAVKKGYIEEGFLGTHYEQQ